MVAGKLDVTKMKSNVLCPGLLYPRAEAAFAAVHFISFSFRFFFPPSKPKALPHAVLEIQKLDARVRVSLSFFGLQPALTSVLEQLHHPVLFSEKKHHRYAVRWPLCRATHTQYKLASVLKNMSENSAVGKLA